LWGASLSSLLASSVFYNNGFTDVVSNSTSFEVSDYVLYDISVSGKIKANYSLKTRSGTLSLKTDTTDVLDLCFYGNSLRTGSLTLPSTVTVLGNRAFQDSGFNASLIVNTVSISSVGFFAFPGGFNALELCASYSGAYLTFNNSTNYSAISLNTSLANITDGTSGAWKTFTIGATNKARLLAAYPNAETDANARYIYVV
jgi:hypothetical protein